MFLTMSTTTDSNTNTHTSEATQPLPTFGSRALPAITLKATLTRLANQASILAQQAATSEEHAEHQGRRIGLLQAIAAIEAAQPSIDA